MIQHFWHIRNCSLFEQMDFDQLQRLERGAQFKKFTKGSAVYLPQDNADSIYLLIDGRIRLTSVTHLGKLAILGFVEPGELFGELALCHDGNREERAEAHSTCSVVKLDGQEFEKLMSNSCHLALKVNKLMGLRRQRIERRLRSLLFKSGRARLASLLLDLVSQYGKPVAEGISIGIRLSHQELAGLIGITRESVTILLGEFQSAGIISTGRQKLTVLSSGKLELISNEEEKARDELPKVHEVKPNVSKPILLFPAIAKPSP